MQVTQLLIRTFQQVQVTQTSQQNSIQLYSNYSAGTSTPQQNSIQLYSNYSAGNSTPRLSATIFKLVQVTQLLSRTLYNYTSTSAGNSTPQQDSLQLYLN